MTAVIVSPQPQYHPVVLQVYHPPPNRFRPPELLTPRDGLSLLEYIRFQRPLGMFEPPEFLLIAEVRLHKGVHGRQPILKALGGAVLRLHVGVQVKAAAANGGAEVKAATLLRTLESSPSLCERR